MNVQTRPRTRVIKIGTERISPGERKTIQLDVAALYDYTQLSVPIEVVNGKRDGPVLFISAAVHGDEINGVEILKRLLRSAVLSRIKGTLIAIPVVNVFGFNHKSRYLPDRRDLNRSFPGDRNGSLASRLASLFMNQVVNKCTHGIDLHTGSIHRTNLPQVRASLDDPETEELARGFGVPVILHSRERDGSLREAARKRKVCTLLFEGGEALRFEEHVIRVGLRGCLSVMRHIGMIPRTRRKPRRETRVFVANQSYWVRASHSGSFRSLKNVGDHVEDGESLAVISDPFGKEPYRVSAEEGGIIIGMSTIPLVNRGDAMVHIATFSNSKRVRREMELADEDYF